MVVITTSTLHNPALYCNFFSFPLLSFLAPPFPASFLSFPPCHRDGMGTGEDDETLKDLHDLVAGVAAAESAAEHSAERAVVAAVGKVAKWLADGEEYAMVLPIRRRLLKVTEEHFGKESAEYASSMVALAEALRVSVLPSVQHKKDWGEGGREGWGGRRRGRKMVDSVILGDTKTTMQLLCREGRR